jgi:SAM-dependent methyltransferase
MIIRQTPLYRFLYFCHKSGLPKTVLDCGAGGESPPLALFHEHGYDVRGIELNEEQRMKAEAFAQEQGIDLHISHGTMLHLPYDDTSLSYVYSYNTIFHMRKADVANAISEIHRVLVPGGLCFVNVLSVDDFRYGTGEKIAEGEYRQEERGEMVVHAYFQDDEPNEYFKDMQILIKEKRIVERFNARGSIKQGYLDYICRR